MRIDIITALPELLKSPFEHSILKRAADKGLLEVHVVNLREYGQGKHNQIDDYAYGGSAGMVMMIEPIATCIRKLQNERSYDAVMYMSPDGQTFNQSLANRFSLMKNIILLCGHYKGSTPVDFAYAVHTEVGNKCVGAKVNGKLVSLEAPLSNGDVVEVVTNKVS